MPQFKIAEIFNMYTKFCSYFTGNDFYGMIDDHQKIFWDITQV